MYDLEIFMKNKLLKIQCKYSNEILENKKAISLFNKPWYNIYVCLAQITKMNKIDIYIALEELKYVYNGLYNIHYLF